MQDSLRLRRAPFPHSRGPTWSVASVFPYCANGVTLGNHIEGNAGRRSLYMPGMNNWDVSLMKDTRLKESLLVEFRAEFFNTWNHTQWGSPSMNLDSSFGTIGGVLVNPRETQLALKLIF